jgi:hypothetical protein
MGHGTMEGSAGEGGRGEGWGMKRVIAIHKEKIDRANLKRGNVLRGEII